MSQNGHDKIMGRMEVMTPDEAGDLLAQNKRNRKMSAAAARRLADTMIAGDWRGDNGETVKIAEDGQILDGQHRLAAVVMANRPVEMMVVRNVPRETFETIDIRRTRRMADMLFIKGEKKNEKDLATALRVLWGYLEQGNFGPIPSYRSPTPTELFDLLKKHGKLRESLVVGSRATSKLPNVPKSVVSVLHYVLSRVNAEEADNFFGDLIGGTNIDGAMLRFRDRLLNRYRGRIAANDAAAMMIKLWNAKRTNTLHQIQAISFRATGPKPEQFPKPL